MDLQQKIEQLFASQQNHWTQLKTSIEQLNHVKTKTVQWNNELYVRIQFNPARMVSAGAKVDQKNIEKRPCFLCKENRPKQQEGIPFLDKYIVLINPFPILKQHLTIPLHSHVAQRIGKKMGDMLQLAAQLPDYVIFYNGPKCGASAPDHFHFQAGLKSPILMAGENELRSCLEIESRNIGEIIGLFEDTCHFLQSRQPQEEEPMFNLIAFTKHDKYVLHIFPRKAHRPRQYFLEGSKGLMVSPGALDMAGLVITVREEDFEKIDREEIEDIFSQVSMPII